MHVGRFWRFEKEIDNVEKGGMKRQRHELAEPRTYRPDLQTGIRRHVRIGGSGCQKMTRSVAGANACQSLRLHLPLYLRSPVACLAAYYGCTGFHPLLSIEGLAAWRPALRDARF